MTTLLAAVNQINNQQTMQSGGAGGLRGDNTTRDEDIQTTIKQITWRGGLDGDDNDKDDDDGGGHDDDDDNDNDDDSHDNDGDDDGGGHDDDDDGGCGGWGGHHQMGRGENTMTDKNTTIK